MSGWVKFHRSEEAAALLSRHPNAFLLLSQIALRARWKDCSITKMKAGEAFLGDWKEAGLPSEAAYRVAKNRLKTCRLATFQGTNKGTIATLTNADIYEVGFAVNSGQEIVPATDEQQASDEPTATNKKDRRIEGKTDDDEDRPRPPSFDEVQAFAKSAPMPVPDDCTEAFFDEMESVQWTYRSMPCIEREAWHARFRRFTTHWNNNERGRGQ